MARGQSYVERGLASQHWVRATQEFASPIRASVNFDGEAEDPCESHEAVTFICRQSTCRSFPPLQGRLWNKPVFEEDIIGRHDLDELFQRCNGQARLDRMG